MSASLDHVLPQGPGVIDLGTKEGSTFDIALRGYARDQVEERLQQWAMALDQAEYERDEALRALAEARAVPATEIEVTSRRLTEILRLGTEEADSLRAHAQADGEEIIFHAREQAGHDVAAAAEERASAADESVRIVDGARGEAHRVLGEAHAEASSVTAGASHAADRLVADAQAEARRMLAGARKEAVELERHIQQRADAALAEHERTLDSYREQLFAARAAVQEDLTALESRRDRALEDIAKLRDVLSGSPTVEEAPLEAELIDPAS